MDHYSESVNLLKYQGVILHGRLQDNRLSHKKAT